MSATLPPITANRRLRPFQLKSGNYLTNNDAVQSDSRPLEINRFRTLNRLLEAGNVPGTRQGTRTLSQPYLNAIARRVSQFTLRNAVLNDACLVNNKWVHEKVKGGRERELASDDGANVWAADDGLEDVMVSADNIGYGGNAGSGLRSIARTGLADSDTESYVEALDQVELDEKRPLPTPPSGVSAYPSPQSLSGASDPQPGSSVGARAPPALPPRDPPLYSPSKPDRLASLVAKTSGSIAGAATAVARTVAKKVDAIKDKHDAKVAEIIAFNAEIARRSPTLDAASKFVMVEKYRVQAIQPQHVTAQLSTFTNRFLHGDIAQPSPPPTSIPGAIHFVNLEHIACIIYKPTSASDPSAPTSRTAQTHVLLTKVLAGPASARLRLASAEPLDSYSQFTTLLQRLPRSFVLFPLVTGAMRRDRFLPDDLERLPRVAVNSSTVLSVNPFDLEWTTIIVVADVRRMSEPKPQQENPGNVGVAVQAAAKRVMEGATRGADTLKQKANQGTLMGDGAIGTFAFQVAMDFAGVLRALDETGI
ncbi:hypothetical protein BC830DRAFT_1079407 [Chytriomyces sp. MP71]|nr:hypothetical protein BC830DRAFT_1079407 [Chytriomyces sp. MP71]